MNNELLQKKSKQGGWGHGISRGIKKKEKECGNCRDQSKKKRNFSGIDQWLVKLWSTLEESSLVVSCAVAEWKGFLLESHWGFNQA